MAVDVGNLWRVILFITLLRVNGRQAESLLEIGDFLKLHLVTYNVGETSPNGNFTALLGLDTDPDIISVGFQEMEQPKKWAKELETIVSGRNLYEVKRRRMKGVQISVFAKKDHLPHITHIESEATSDIGLYGYFGNKRATTIRFRLYDKTVAIVNSHLAAHMNEIKRRNKDFKKILSGQNFHEEKTRNIDDHDYVFWMGDLNYRLGGTNEVVRRAIAARDLPSLLQYDQLKNEQVAGRVFEGYTEADITNFPPTYKFDLGTDRYDTSEKNRVPAWCDRVLWRSRGGCAHPVLYKSLPQYRQSDHKPVTALLKVGVNPNFPALATFTQKKYVWRQGQDLTVSLTLSPEYPHSVSPWVWSSSDKVTLFRNDWTDVTNEFLSSKKFKEGRDDVTFPAKAFPKEKGSYMLVFVSEKLGAPVAAASVSCE